jgi:hypothetical protein
MIKFLSAKGFWTRPWFWLALQAALLFAAACRHDEMAPEGHNEGQRLFYAYNDGYLKNSLASELSGRSFVDSLTSNRTIGLPLFLKCVRTFSPSFSAWPLWYLSVRVLAVFIFCLGLRALGVSAWLAAALSSTLFYSDLSFWSRWFYQFVGPDGVAESLAILTVGMLLCLVSRPRNPLAWLGLTVSLFVTYQTHPSYLFLLGLVPLLGVVLLGLVSAHADWIRYRLRVGLGLLAAGVLPYLGWCTLRLALVGHFGLVSFAGYTSVYVPGVWLSDDVVPDLPEDLRPLALAVLRDRAQLTDWQPPRDKEGRFHFSVDFVADEKRLTAITWPSADLFAENAMKLYGGRGDTANEGYGQDWVAVDRKLAAMTVALIKARPSYYADWLVAAFRAAMYSGLITPLLKYLVRLLIVLVAVWHIVYVSQRLRLGPARLGERIRASGNYYWALNVMMLLAISFALARIVQVILVTCPSERYISPAGVFLPTVAVVAVFALGQQIRQLLFVPSPSAISNQAKPES